MDILRLTQQIIQQETAGREVSCHSFALKHIVESGASLPFDIGDNGDTSSETALGYKAYIKMGRLLTSRGQNYTHSIETAIEWLRDRKLVTCHYLVASNHSEIDLDVFHSAVLVPYEEQLGTENLYGILVLERMASTFYVSNFPRNDTKKISDGVSVCTIGNSIQHYLKFNPEVRFYSWPD